MYNAIVLQFLKRAQAKTPWQNGEPCVYRAELGAKAQGSWLKLFLKINQGSIEEIRYQVLGSGYLIATLEWAKEYLEHQSLETAQAFNAKLMIDALDLPAHRVHCALMVAELVQDILRELK